MWRALVLATGISLAILGAEFMVVDRIVIADPDSSATVQPEFGSPTLSTWSAPLSSKRRVFCPPEWAPWGFLSAGIMLVLYGASLSRE